MARRTRAGIFVCWLLMVSLVASALVLAACFGDNSKPPLGAVLSDAGLPDIALPDVAADATLYSVGGSVQGLDGSGLVLEGNGVEDLPVPPAGGAPVSFTFPTKVPSGTPYTVTIKAQPTNPSQKCVVAGGTGTVVVGNVTSLNVNCTTDQYAVGGTITGLAGGGLTLKDNGADTLTVNANGTFAFATLLPSGSTYSVTISAQPTNPGQTCTLFQGSGTVGSANVKSVQVSCVTNKYVVGGDVSGLVGTRLVLQDNGGDDLPIAGNGSFTFATRLAGGSAFSVTVKTQPSNPVQSCSVSGGSGTIGSGDVAGV